MSDLTEGLTRLLFNSSFMTLATSDRQGIPWATPVEFACDEELRFYWTSLVEARHSRNVRANPRAALTIYNSTQAAGVDAEVQGIYAEGEVEELGALEAAAVLPTVRRWIAWRDPGRVSSGTDSEASAQDEASIWRQYRVTPAKLYALDPGGHPDIPGVRVWRIAIDLSDSYRRAYRSRVDAAPSDPNSVNAE